MSKICTAFKEVIVNPTLHTLLVALFAMYLLFGVLNAGFIMVQVLAIILEFFYSHALGFIGT